MAEKVYSRLTERNFLAWKVSYDACVTACSSVIISDVAGTMLCERDWSKDQGSTHEDLPVLQRSETGGGEEGGGPLERRIVGSTGGCALADTAAKTPPGRQGLANITGQQCADRHHATRLLLRGASLRARAVPRDNPPAYARNPLPPKRKLAPREQAICREKSGAVLSRRCAYLRVGR